MRQNKERILKSLLIAIYGLANTGVVFFSQTTQASATLSDSGALLKYDHIYFNPAENGTTCRAGISEFLKYYNEERPHSSLGDATPDEVNIRYASTSELPEPVTTCSPLKKSVRLSKRWGPLDPLTFV